MNLTPEHWRQVRIIDAEQQGKYSVVSFHVRSRFGPLALAALGIDATTPTEGISRAAAVTLGEKMEKRLGELNGKRGAKARQS